MTQGMTGLRQIMTRCFVGVLIMMLVGGCASGSISLPGTGPRYYSALRYVTWMQTARLSELESEYQRLTAEQESRTGIRAVQLALLISASSLADANSEEEALDILEGMDTEDIALWPGDYRRLANIWQDILERRLNLKSALAELETDGSELERLRLENQRLREQIESLTNIETQILNRERLQGP